MIQRARKNLLIANALMLVAWSSPSCTRSVDPPAGEVAEKVPASRPPPKRARAHVDMKTPRRPIAATPAPVRQLPAFSYRESTPDTGGPAVRNLDEEEERFGNVRGLGGTPVADTTFRDYGVNPTIATAAENVSTFSVDVDTAWANRQQRK